MRPGQVTDLAYSPDGKILASASGLGKIFLWDSATGKLVGELEGHEQGVEAIIFVSNGKAIFSAGKDGTIRLWDVEKREQAQVLEGHEGPVHTIAITPDRSTLASGGHDGFLRLWNLATGKLISESPWFAAGVAITSVAFSPDGYTLAGGSVNFEANLFNPTKDKESRKLRDNQYTVHSLAFSPDGLKLATGSTTGIRIWDVEKGEVLLRPRDPQDEDSLRILEEGEEPDTYKVVFSPGWQAPGDSGR